MKVDSKLWSRMDDDQQMDALLTVFKDPDDAEMYVGEKWDDLPEEKNFMTTTIKPLVNEDLTSLVRDLTPREYKMFAREMDIDEEDANQMMDFLSNLDDREAEFLSKKLETGDFKDLSEEDAVSWKYNNSPARGGTLDLVPRKVGQSIKEKVFKGLREQYSTMGRYVDEMDLDDHLDNIHYEFEKFSAMTTTDIKDIQPAKEELISYVVDYLRNTL